LSTAPVGIFASGSGNKFSAHRILHSRNKLHPSAPSFLVSVASAAMCGYQLTRHMVISSEGHVVTPSTRHRTTHHTRLVTQSTCHKSA